MGESPHPVDSHEEPEYYVEPAEMRGKDIAGVIVALLALAVIGLSGYVWLNPDLGFSDLGRMLRPRDSSSKQSGDVQAATSGDSASGASEVTKTTPSMKADSCPYCGMFTAPSESHIKASWSNGSHSDHDCWDCAFAWARQEGLTLENVRVRRYGSSEEEPDWLDARNAVFLYDVKDLKGSMPPYVAAFADQSAAVAAQPQLGGEQLDWSGLQARFTEAK